MSLPEPLREWTLGELADLLDGQVLGEPGTVITGVSGLDDARPGTLVRIEEPRYLARALECPATAFLVPKGIETVDRAAIRVGHPKAAFARVMELLHPEPRPEPGIHPTAVRGRACALGEGCALLPHVVLGDRVRIGKRVVLHPHVTIGDDTVIGDDSVLFAGVRVYARVEIGKRVRIHGNAVIGADGFGYVWDGRKHQKVPQVGMVVIEDDVEIGAMTAVDRATTDVTVIGAGTKIDNLVQVGHNVRIGRHCVVVSLTGIGGGTRIGNGVAISGLVGIRDHVQIGDGAQVTMMSGVWRDLPAGGTYSGHPARGHREELRSVAIHERLPALEARIRELERRLAETEKART